MDDQAVAALEARLGYCFANRALLVRALTHRSFANEHGLPENYERLEFLGDSVLGLLTVEALFRLYVEKPEGDLSRMKSHIVSEPVLARYARELGLGEALRLGVGEDRSGGRDKPSLLADALEATIGACYLDAGIDAARALVTPMLQAVLAENVVDGYGDPKTHLQELAQANGWELPCYRLVHTEGPDHAKSFEIECVVNDTVSGSGSGRTKKQAERIAAIQALERWRPTAAT